MNNQALHIYYRKKYLRRSGLLYLSSLLIWLGIYFIFILQPFLKRDPSVGERTHLVGIIILTLIFGAWATKYVRILLICITEYPSAPKIAYSLNEDGIESYRNGWFINWHEILDAASIVFNEGYYFRKSKTIGFSMNSWGIDPQQMKLARAFIKKKLPESKTKRIM